jgi:hypothetical protein
MVDTYMDKKTFVLETLVEIYSDMFPELDKRIIKGHISSGLHIISDALEETTSYLISGPLEKDAKVMLSVDLS